MQTVTKDDLRQQLTERQARLRRAIAESEAKDDLVRLLEQVDSALSRMDTGEYGRCLVCHTSVYDKDLANNPLLEYCLCELTPQQQRALEHDLELARRIQAGLLPDPDLVASGWEACYRYEPAGVVSGDYCDLWSPPGDGGAIYFAVGDVSGKGLAASLLMAHLQAAFRSLVGVGLPLAALVERMNRQLLEAQIPSHFATLACGRLADDGRVELVNAGHCSPLLARRGRVESLAPTGLPVGVEPGRSYEVMTLRLDPGDTLVLYTDGLTEARAPGGQQYGPRRLELLLPEHLEATSPRRLVQAIRDDLAEYLGQAPRSDDLTIMAVKRVATR